MTPHAYLCLVLHNHQPIGNFDGVFEQAYQDSYLPFLEVFEPFESLQISLHTSGPLMIWLSERHPEYIDRLRMLIDAGRVEIVGGPQYEPIMTMLPSRDRIGQIQVYSNWLHRTLGVRPRGMWMPERVWESSLTRDVVDAGIEYTVLDDYHFRAAGLRDQDLRGYFLTEDDGRLLRVFPGSERLRYTIPFRPAQETIDHCRQFAEQSPGAVLTFGDDGEKFGTWPDTKVHVYEKGWLRSFFTALCENASWLKTVTLAEAVTQTAPAGKVYLPDCSYREMTEWALPTESQETFDEVTHAMEDHPQWGDLKPFIRGGYWRNFKSKYEETNEMYARMMSVSRRLADAEAAASDPLEIARIRDDLYRGQCNCPYWHGAFGGIYLPHLRNAIYQHLIAADNRLSKLEGMNEQTVLATADDYNFDGLQEVRLSNNRLCAWIAPGHGGRMYELDVREIRHNLLATLQRRPENYHRKVLAGPHAAGEDVASIHDRVVFKQADLDQRLQYDRYARKSLMDHFYDNDASLQSVARGEAEERGDFVDLPFETKIRRGADRVQVQMRRDGNAWGIPITLTKAVTLCAGSDRLAVTYLLENLPQDRPLHFAIEMNFAGLPSGADDRYFSDLDGHRYGQLGEELDLRDAHGLSLSDRWLGIDVRMEIDRPSGIWAFPISTVSQSESGFELVHQSVCVQPHWIVTGDADGRWVVQIEMAANCEPSAETIHEEQVIRL
ncbi:alpha-amylase/4-alpha-glucanotransferase domain-containing protein [Novipirellula artificiosorum]|uniref:Alpha-amylase 1 n=1 Tax=Novipirellula artificiosorum TaxID=2528016 RepID=A0A5C6DML6_9BACT|nr:alpha-amylase/4-alpha-glucanotransferase domain-containing protein [Novipirellula artificiosorum]TWU37405.1 Alpha-amylase 1 [Novipirellula artificiosorum]